MLSFIRHYNSIGAFAADDFALLIDCRRCRRYAMLVFCYMH
jgi:hypothetical protein